MVNETGPVIFITGANRGIGLETTRHLIAEGYRIGACVRSRSTELDQLIDGDSRHHLFKLDLSDDASIKACAQQALEWAGRVDGLVNCAGLAQGSPFAMTRMNDMRDIFNVNLFGTLALTQFLVKKMIRSKNGSIVNIASTAGLVADPGTMAYGVSKAALIHATKIMAAELGAFNIRANAIAPAVVETEMAAQMDQKARDLLDSRAAMPGTIDPSDIASAIGFLLSDKSAKISGQVIRIDRAMAF